MILADVGVGDVFAGKLGAELLLEDVDDVLEASGFAGTDVVDTALFRIAGFEVGLDDVVDVDEIPQDFVGAFEKARIFSR